MNNTNGSFDMDGQAFDFAQTESDPEAVLAASQTLNVPGYFTWTTSPTSSDSSHLAGALDGKASGGSPLLTAGSIGESSSGLVVQSDIFSSSTSGSHFGEFLGVGDAHTQDFTFGGISHQANSGVDDVSYGSYNGSYTGSYSGSYNGDMNISVSPLMDNGLYTSPQHSWPPGPLDGFGDDSLQIMSPYSWSPQMLCPSEEFGSDVVSRTDVGVSSDRLRLGTASFMTSQTLEPVERQKLLVPPKKDPKAVRFRATLDTGDSAAATTSLGGNSMSSSSGSGSSSNGNNNNSRNSSSSNSGGSSNNNGGGSDGRRPHSRNSRKVFACERKDCNRPVFTRMADLERHNRHIHLDADKKDCFLCDYATCSRSAMPFHRKDHYREHLREYHLEDLLKRGSNAGRSTSPRHHHHHHHHSGETSPSSSAATTTTADYKKTKKQLQETQLQNCKTDATWWRCARCLKRVDIESRGWTCPSCKGSIEEPRKAIRQSRVEQTAWMYDGISTEAYE